MNNPSYFELRDEDSWIEYLRVRLPYSFKTIEKRAKKQTYYVLSDPLLQERTEFSEYHNFWRRGNVSYMMGKLLDYYGMSEVGKCLRELEILSLMTQGTADLRRPWPINISAFYNSMQVEKLWRHAQESHLERERVMILNVTQSVELCLKAVSTHANYRETGCFRFSDGHDVTRLYEELPQSLKDTIARESQSFAKEYLAFRTQLNRKFSDVVARQRNWSAASNSLQQTKFELEQLAKRMMESSYTAFLQSNDPGATYSELNENWFEKALCRIRNVENKGGISVFFRYAPFRDKDTLPVDLLHQMLLLGRFMYEYLFPVPLKNTDPIFSFPSRD